MAMDAPRSSTRPLSGRTPRIPTKNQLNPEEDGDTPVDTDNPIYWSIIRHMGDDGKTGKVLNMLG